MKSLAKVLKPLRRIPKVSYWNHLLSRMNPKKTFKVALKHDKVLIPDQVPKNAVKALDDLNVVIRDKGDYAHLVKTHSKFRRITKNIQRVARPAAVAALVGTGVGLLADYFVKFTAENSGCFVYSLDTDKNVCKMVDWSCCQKESAHPCQKMANPGLCDGYDDEDECCRECDCQHVDCGSLPENTALRCHRATVGEAVVHLASMLGNEILDTSWLASTARKILLLALVVFLVYLIVRRMIKSMIK